jgi:hypothetical protein
MRPYNEDLQDKAIDKSSHISVVQGIEYVIIYVGAQALYHFSENN